MDNMCERALKRAHVYCSNQSLSWGAEVGWVVVWVVVRVVVWVVVLVVGLEGRFGFWVRVVGFGG